MFAYLIFITYYELLGNYHKAIEVCKEALQFFENQPKQTANTVLFAFERRLIIYYTTLRYYAEAERVAKVALNLAAEIHEGNKNWYNALDHTFVLYLHSKQYNKAYQILLKAQRHKRFKDLYPKDKEIWEVYNAYMHYFIRLGKVDSPPEGGHSLKKFRFYKFLNSVPMHSKDKRGVNVAILILQIMFLLEKEKFDDVIERSDALHQYCYKYLKKDETYRSSCFIKMLTILPNAYFHKAGVIRKTNIYLDKLKGTHHDGARQTSDIEIVPYEQLWELVLESLTNEFQYKKKRGGERAKKS